MLLATQKFTKYTLPYVAYKDKHLHGVYINIATVSVKV